MKLMTFEVQTALGRFCRLGALVNLSGSYEPPVVVDLNAAHTLLLAEDGEPQPKRLADVELPSDMRQFIEMGDRALDAAGLVLECCRRGGFEETEGINGEQLVFSLEEITWKPPLANPPMMRDFLAFETHTKAGFDRRKQPMPEAWYQLPVYYKGNPNRLIGHQEAVVWPKYTAKLDFELELACIIGKQGQDVAVNTAASHIFGYAIMNDFSARDIQAAETTCRLGPAKGKDFATAIGPYIVTADEVGNPRNLMMTARLNGKEITSGNSGTSHWTFEQMIAYVSNEEILYPGDILCSGTVGNGCGWELGIWLQPGDQIELEIENIGILQNRVVTHPGFEVPEKFDPETLGLGLRPQEGVMS
ncbi:MAG: fumarylacetoacetate hydrolase family protein [Vampirovibrio sp.]|nr:fumarylacetoacetate hydrolase family protein [Vampirovibrio sp.]